MEINGKLLQINDPVTGESSKGKWKKQELIIESDEKYPRKVCLLNWNDKVDISNLKPGDQLKASVNVESREFKGRWFTDVKLWKLDKSDGENPTAPENQNNISNNEAVDDPFAEDSGNEEDSLPF